MLQYYMPLVGYPYQGNFTACPVCASTSHRPLSRFDRRLKQLSTVLCDDCGLMFTNPMPTDTELELYYRTQYRLDYQFSLGRPGQRHVRKKQREAAARYASLASHLSNRTVRMLDFGSGSGELVRHFALQGHSATGLEPGAGYARHAVDIAPANGSFRIDNERWQSVAYPEHSFELVTMLHVLEHLSQPIAALRAVHRWLTSDGLLLVEVPNMQGYDLKSFERFHFAHVLGFSRDNLIHAARLAGFSVVRELAPTTLLLAKAQAHPCRSTIDLAGTARLNRAEYSQPVSVTRYVMHHAKRLSRRLLRQ